MSSDTAAQQATRRGIRWMVVSMTAFTFNDTLVKLVSEGMAAGQLIFLRGVLATGFVLLALRWGSAQALSNFSPRQVLSRWVVIRSLVDGLATLVFLVSLFHLPLSTAVAINMVTPLVIAALAAWWLGERVGLRRWVLIGLGFAGVLMVIQPGPEGLNAWAWLCLAGTGVTALRDALTRRIPAHVPSLVITLSTAVTVTLMAAVVMAFQGWQPVSLAQAAQLTAAAAFLAAGYHFIIRSTRSGDLSAIAPFRYVGLLIAVVLGWALWGHIPNALGWAGIALIVGAGLVLLRRPGA